MTFDGLPRGGKGYKEASAVLEAEIRRLWDWLVDMHALGRPAGRRRTGCAGAVLRGVIQRAH